MSELSNLNQVGNKLTNYNDLGYYFSIKIPPPHPPKKKKKKIFQNEQVIR